MVDRHLPAAPPAGQSMLARPRILRSGHADLAKLSGRNLPDLRIHQFQRHVTGVTDLAQAVDDRRKLKIAVARQDAIAVGGKLASHA